jgi:hypothetical protein
MNRKLLRTLVILLVAVIGLSASLRADTFHYSGTIATGPQFDLYTLRLADGTRVVADTHCAAPPNNTLDTILTAYAPNVDPSTTANATFYNDDGGTELCGGFHNSHLDFQVHHTGDWTFRVDGFGSAIGDYTLDIVTSFNGIQEIPTLGPAGLGLLVLLLGGTALIALRRLRRA